MGQLLSRFFPAKKEKREGVWTIGEKYSNENFGGGKRQTRRHRKKIKKTRRKY